MALHNKKWCQALALLATLALILGSFSLYEDQLFEKSYQEVIPRMQDN